MMWSVAALNKKYPDALGNYNSLYDPHLNQYFRNPKVRNHLVHAGLMTSEGKVVPEAVVRLKKLEDDRRKQLHQLLTEVLERGETNRSALKRLHQTRNQESEAKWELVQRAKIAFDTTHTGPNGRTNRAHSQKSSSDRTAKSSSSATSMSWLKRVVQIRPKLFTNKKRRVKVNALNRYQRPKSSYGIRSSNKVKPDLQSEKELNEQFSDILSLDGESIRNSDDDEDSDRKSSLWPKKKNKSAIVTLRFNGLTMNCLIPRRVQISQQLYSGGNAISIFDKMVSPGGLSVLICEKLSFSVRPHGSKPFCMTVLIDGIRDLRVSTCCEHKHKKGHKISHFTLVDVIGGKMCANCRKGMNESKSAAMSAMSAMSAANSADRDVKTTVKQSEQIVTANEDNVINSEVSDCEETVVELEKSSRSASPTDANDYNEDQFENYESEFEAETPESVRIRSSSMSSDESVVARREVVAAEIHTNRL